MKILYDGSGKDQPKLIVIAVARLKSLCAQLEGAFKKVFSPDKDVVMQLSRDAAGNAAAFIKALCWRKVATLARPANTPFVVISHTASATIFYGTNATGVALLVRRTETGAFLESTALSILLPGGGGIIPFKNSAGDITAVCVYGNDTLKLCALDDADGWEVTSTAVIGGVFRIGTSNYVGAASGTVYKIYQASETGWELRDTWSPPGTSGDVRRGSDMVILSSFYADGQAVGRVYKAVGDTLTSLTVGEFSRHDFTNATSPDFAGKNLAVFAKLVTADTPNIDRYYYELHMVDGSSDGPLTKTVVSYMNPYMFVLGKSYIVDFRRANLSFPSDGSTPVYTSADIVAYRDGAYQTLVSIPNSSTRATLSYVGGARGGFHLIYGTADRLLSTSQEQYIVSDRGVLLRSFAGGPSSSEITATAGYAIASIFEWPVHSAGAMYGVTDSGVVDLGISIMYGGSYDFVVKDHVGGVLTASVLTAASVVTAYTIACINKKWYVIATADVAPDGSPNMVKKVGAFDRGSVVVQYTSEVDGSYCVLINDDGTGEKFTDARQASELILGGKQFIYFEPPEDEFAAYLYDPVTKSIVFTLPTDYTFAAAVGRYVVLYNGDGFELRYWDGSALVVGASVASAALSSSYSLPTGGVLLYYVTFATEEEPAKRHTAVYDLVDGEVQRVAYEATTGFFSIGFGTYYRVLAATADGVTSRAVLAGNSYPEGIKASDEAAAASGGAFDVSTEDKIFAVNSSPANELLLFKLS